MDTVHALIDQVNNGMKPATKRSKTRVTERRIEELYTRFKNNRITIDDLLRGLSLFVAHKK